MTVIENQRERAPGVSEEAFTELVAAVKGPVIRPGDPLYDEARSVQNGMIDRRPAVIVRCLGNADVIAAVNFAREHDLLLAIKGGGHNVAGNAVCEDGLVIELALMRGVHVDPRSRTVRVQGGALLSDVERESQLYGLAVPSGVVSTTGVAGLTLHGGMGHLRRKYGLTIDSLLSVDIVTADGQLRRASQDENADLFWAVRGAGSNFGVVTSFEFQAYPLGPTVMLGAVLYHLDDAPSVLRKWRAFMDMAPEEISSLAVFWSVPEGFPPELVGTPIVITAAVYAGPAEVGAAALQPLREFGTPLLDMSGPTPWVGIQSAFDPFFPKGLHAYWKSRYVESLPDELIDLLCRIAANRPSKRTPIDIWHHGGAMSRVPADATAFGDRHAPYMLSFDGTWENGDDDDVNVTWARDSWNATEKFSDGGLYLNFPGLGEDNEALLRAGHGANYERLSALKAKYDPTNLFRMNLNIKPRG